MTGHTAFDRLRERMTPEQRDNTTTKATTLRDAMSAGKAPAAKG